MKGPHVKNTLVSLNHTNYKNALALAQLSFGGPQTMQLTVHI